MLFDNSGEKITDYKKGLNAEESRRRRQDGLLELRHTQRRELMTKRRQLGAAARLDEQSVSVDDINRFKKGIMDNNPKTQYECTLCLRKIISKRFCHFL
ncbi:hypothetical protein MHBO_001869 [Bonamia ostreae]|uniref:IBB domain-containing protein n=1 Tax=Bonamia ostreae TaxID=126728 RepID=A0ABV2AKF2_9EUKA